jgi:hypothetical protein
MELVLVVTFAGLLGAGLRYVLPGRDRHGLGLLPSVAVVIGSLVWSISVWLGLDPGSVWPWLTSLGLAVAGVIGLGLWLPKRRDVDDAQLFDNLTHPGRQVLPASNADPAPATS